MAWLIAYLASPAGDFFSGCVITIDGARDNWFGSWPPPGASGEAGEPLAEERREDWRQRRRPLTITQGAALVRSP